MAVTSFHPSVLGSLFSVKSNLIYRSVASPTADPGVASLNPTRSHTFVEIDHEIISTVNLANSEDTDDMPHYAAFHQGLHCLLRQNRSSEKEIKFILKI